MDADRLAQLLDDPGRALALTPPEAAALLGIDPKNLRYYLRKHDMVPTKA